MYNDIIHFLDQRRLKEGFIQLKAFSAETDNWKLRSDIDNLQTTYNYMLQYAEMGQADPERKRLFNDLLRSGYELTDRTEFIRKFSKEYGSFSDKFRGYQQNPARSYQEIGDELALLDQSICENDLLNNREDGQPTEAHPERRLAVVDELFNRTWTATHWNKEEYQEVCQLAADKRIKPFDIAVFISGVTLNLLYYLDPLKLQFLISLYQQSEEEIIRQRTLAGIVLGVYYHEKRIQLYPNLTTALSMLTEQDDFIKQIHNVQWLLMLSRETEKIDKKMREEIIPQMMKNPYLSKPDMKISNFDLKELEEKNPEWDKDMEHIGEKFREIGELQMEGADTYMSTFCQLKNYAFFKEAAHWFYPFSKEVPEIKAAFGTKQINDKSFLGIMLNSPIFCNSDKYSFCLAIKSLPAEHVDTLTFNVPGDEANVKEQLADSVNANKLNEDKVLCRQYLQDLYRFFKLWNFRQQQHDIFTDKLTLWECNTLRTAIFAENHEQETADYLFNKGYLDEAADLYADLSDKLPSQADIKQKLGFTLQKMKDYEGAIKNFELADILKPNDGWTLKHLAQCYKRIKDYEKALKYFQQVEHLEPENLNILLQIGQCLATLRAYDKALAYFFKVEYLGKAPENARRAIGWCYFMTGKYADAARFYEKIIQEATPDSDDWLNYGHVHLAQGEMPQALECYRKSAASFSTHEEFVKVFIADKKALLEQGIDEETLFITLDLI